MAQAAAHRIAAQSHPHLASHADATARNSYESLKKSDLEAALDEFIAGHSTRLSNRSDLTGYFNSRSKALGSPVKRESLKDEAERALKVVKRKASKAAEELTPE